MDVCPLCVPVPPEYLCVRAFGIKNKSEPLPFDNSSLDPLEEGKETKENSFEILTIECSYKIKSNGEVN